ncbi:hypothetical protein A0H81_01198 [Grifola frondosa]|uniref:Uncharacterized protein n=1 Tax=Grifola frondosa TaxID=5627 RepID=A0A1C7MT15_GRIFR|nr:hypothetical protein A0H81_01198 [Grifola frondosa]
MPGGLELLSVDVAIFPSGSDDGPAFPMGALHSGPDTDSTRKSWWELVKEETDMAPLDDDQDSMPDLRSVTDDSDEDSIADDWQRWVSMMLGTELRLTVSSL